MKAINTGIHLLLTILIFTQCVKEDIDDCPVDIEYNLILTFEYFDKENKDIFDDRINCIDVILYDHNHNLYQWIQADEVISTTERTKSLKVAPGTYHIVSWANNINDRATRQNNPLITLQNTYIYHNVSSQSTDELHYAPDLRGKKTQNTTNNITAYTVIVPPAEITHQTISYMSAHRTINIYLKGFYEVTEPGTDPQISIINLTQYYDNSLNRGEENTTYNKNAKEITIEQQKLGYAGFFVPHFDNQSPVKVIITGNDNMGIPYQHNVTMDQILRELELTVEDGDDAIIDIIIELKGTYVEVQVPEWKIIDVKPGFNE